MNADTVLQSLTLAAAAITEWMHLVAVRLSDGGCETAAVAAVALALLFIFIATFAAHN